MDSIGGWLVCTSDCWTWTWTWMWRSHRTPNKSRGIVFFFYNSLAAWHSSVATAQVQWCCFASLRQSACFFLCCSVSAPHSIVWSCRLCFIIKLSRQLTIIHHIEGENGARDAMKSAVVFVRARYCIDCPWAPLAPTFVPKLLPNAFN